MITDDLSADLGRLARLATIHPGMEFTADPLAAAIDSTVTEMERGLTRLADAHIVTVVAQARYRVRNAPCERVLKVVEDRPALRGMIEWYLRRAAADVAINVGTPRFSPVYEQVDTEPFPNTSTALDWFALERANVLAAQRAAAREGWDGLVFQLAETVWNPMRASYFAEDLLHTQQLGITAAQRCRHVLEAVFLVRAGFAESSLNRHDEAITACTKALERAASNRWIQAAALSTRARALTAAGQPRAALDDLGKALLIDQQHDDRPGIALRHRRSGQAYAHPKIADFPQAIWHLRESAAMMEALSDDAGRTRVLTYLAGVHVRANQPDAALFTLRLIENSVSSCGSTRYQAHAYAIQGQAHTLLGHTADAARFFDNTLALLANAGPEAATDRDRVQQLRDELGR